MDLLRRDKKSAWNSKPMKDYCFIPTRKCISNISYFWWLLVRFYNKFHSVLSLLSPLCLQIVVKSVVRPNLYFRGVDVTNT